MRVSSVSRDERARTAAGKRVSDEMHRVGDKWPPGLSVGGPSGPMSSEQRVLLILMRKGGAHTGEGGVYPRDATRTPQCPPPGSPCPVQPPHLSWLWGSIARAWPASAILPATSPEQPR